MYNTRANGVEVAGRERGTRWGAGASLQINGGMPAGRPLRVSVAAPRNYAYYVLQERRYYTILISAPESPK